jgi:hypothetical protein
MARGYSPYIGRMTAWFAEYFLQRVGARGGPAASELRWNALMDFPVMARRSSQFGLAASACFSEKRCGVFVQCRTALLNKGLQSVSTM